MFMPATSRRNPALLEGAARLHREGRVPPNCYVIDLDTVERNAEAIARAAAQRGLRCFQMTKQFGRNPVVARAVAARGIEAVVAVDFEEARLLHRHGLRIGHLGHLTQVPAGQLGAAVGMRPEVVTVFGVEQARLVAAAAREAGTEQRLLVRVVGDDDFFYPAQRGGVPAREVLAVAQEIDALDGASFGGLTSFPCLMWNPDSGELEPTQNLATLRRTAAALRSAGVEVADVNAPGATCIAALDALQAGGATQVEPGSALTGNTPLHAVSDEPELPAMVYVTEVTHQLDGVTYALGGGLYSRSRARDALVYTRDGVRTATVQPDPAGNIDYHGAMAVDDAEPVRIGDSVVYAFRSQVFVSRAFVAVVRDLGDRPEVLGVFDRGGFRLGDDLLPVGAEGEA
jgi:predicted amino acid racemase